MRLTTPRRSPYAPLAALMIATLAAAGCPFQTGGLQSDGLGSGGGATTMASTSSTSTGIGGLTTSSSGATSSSGSSSGIGGGGGSSSGVSSSGASSSGASSSTSSTSSTSTSSGGTCAGTDVCVPDAPSGWTIVAFTPTTQPACPAGYTKPTKLVQAPTPASNMCDCSCGAPQANPCTQGTFTVAFGQTACGGISIMFTSDGKCDAIGMKIGTDQGSNNMNFKDLQATPLPVTAVDCATSSQLPALTPGAGGRTCVPPAPGAGSCSAGAACLPPVPAAEQCVQAAGDIPCPSATFTNRYVVYAAADVTDQRSCAACSCKSTATKCTNATLTTYAMANCTGGNTKVTVDGTCNNFPSGADDHNDDHFIYNATPDTMACAAVNAKVAVMGAVATNNPTTICCP